MSKRLVRPPMELPAYSKKDIPISLDSDIPNFSTKFKNPVISRKYQNNSAIGITSLGNKINGSNNLMNQHSKGLLERDKTLHNNRDTSGDNPLRHESKRKKAHELRKFTHSMVAL